ncbi:MAG: Unknown protein, partial [uncultured Thiotrichaceae bacterium]
MIKVAVSISALFLTLGLLSGCGKNETEVQEAAQAAEEKVTQAAEEATAVEAKVEEEAAKQEA